MLLSHPLLDSFTSYGTQLFWRMIVLDEALVGWFDTQPPRLNRLPRGTERAEVLADSVAHQRLAEKVSFFTV